MEHLNTAHHTHQLWLLPPLQMASTNLEHFFQCYDSLQKEASKLTSEETSLNQAKQTHWKAHHELKRATSAFSANQEFITEQRDRINLVSTHWFYGTTAFQPQLWLRGGCQGKVQRARDKFEKAQADHPKYQELTRKLQRDEEEARAILQGQQASRDRASEAAAEVEAMKEEIAQQYPSTQLSQLQSQATAVQQRVKEKRRRKDYLNGIGRTLRLASNSFQNAESKLRDAKQKFEKAAEQMVKQEVQLALPVTDVTTTNRSCPNGCGFVITRHANYCCRACSARGRHGPKCERIPFSSPPGARDMSTRMQEQGQEHTRKVDTLRQQARTDLEDAERKRQDGVTALQQATSNLSCSIGDQIVVMMPVANRGYCSNDCTCYSVPNQAQQIQQVVREHQSMVKQHEAYIFQLQSDVDQEVQSLEQQWNQHRNSISQEKTRIFDELRASRGGFLPGAVMACTVDQEIQDIPTAYCVPMRADERLYSSFLDTIKSP